MTPIKRTMRTEFVVASVLVGAGLAIIGASLSYMPSATAQKMAQATQPLQSTPGADTKPFAPDDPASKGARPHEIAPQPARPDADAVDAGARRALPPAPPEKIGEPIPAK
jgi:hypothetical protein